MPSRGGHHTACSIPHRNWRPSCASCSVPIPTTGFATRVTRSARGRIVRPIARPTLRVKRRRRSRSIAGPTSGHRPWLSARDPARLARVPRAGMGRGSAGPGAPVGRPGARYRLLGSGLSRPLCCRQPSGPARPRDASPRDRPEILQPAPARAFVHPDFPRRSGRSSTLAREAVDRARAGDSGAAGRWGTLASA